MYDSWMSLVLVDPSRSSAEPPSASREREHVRELRASGRVERDGWPFTTAARWSADLVAAVRGGRRPTTPVCCPA